VWLMRGKVVHWRAEKARSDADVMICLLESARLHVIMAKTVVIGKHGIGRRAMQANTSKGC